MTTSNETRKFDINLKNPYCTMYTAVASSESRVIELLEDELSDDDTYLVSDFEIEDCGKAVDQMGNYFEESFRAE